jgi:hypothetical protein
LTFIDASGHVPVGIDTSGAKDHCYASQEAMDYLAKAPRGSVTATHNHPSSSSLSDADLRMLAANPAFREVRAIGHDGTQYSMIGGGKTVMEYDAQYNRTYNLRQQMGDSKRSA